MDDIAFPSRRAICPHCHAKVAWEKPIQWDVPLSKSEDEDDPFSYPRGLNAHIVRCPACDEYVIDLVAWEHPPEAPDALVSSAKRVHPAPRARLSGTDVPHALWSTYLEAQQLRPHSSTASAILARRCLQAVLHDQGFKAHDLNAEIELAAKGARVTSSLRQSLHIVRQVGNYGAHPIIDGKGDPLQVEPGEAEAALDAIEELFEVFYVKPAHHKRLLAAINAKLQSANKPPIT